MQGYHWAETADGELLVVMFAHGKGYVPGVDNAIDLSIITVLEPVPWPAPTVRAVPKLLEKRAPLRLVASRS